jgi:hypothetical protein
MPKRFLPLLATLILSAAASEAWAADFRTGGAGASAHALGGGAGASAYALGGPTWYPGGNHWRGHHSLRWRDRNPDHVFSTPGWGAPWFYTPRTYYELERPRIIVPEPVEPVVVYGPPAPWTAQWYAYCSDRFRSFEPSTGFYTTYSGARRMCR